MRVLVLNYEYPPLGGGAANAMFHILREFGRIGAPEIDVVTSSADGKAAVEELEKNVRIHKVPVRKERIHYWTSREIFDYYRQGRTYAGTLMREREYDLCHAFFALPCGHMASRYAGRLPYIVSLRGSDVPGFNERLSGLEPFLKHFFRGVLAKAAAVQANSAGLKDLALLTSPGTDIEVIHNGVDCGRFAPRPAVRAVAGQGGPLRLLAVCRLIERKGLADLIKALPRIGEVLGDIRLTVVGEGNLENELKDLSATLGVADKIDWKGATAHSDLPDIYRDADVFVLPSHFEGMSNSLLEAMASGLAVVVTDTGGTKELFSDNGRIVPAGDPDGIAKAVIALGRDRALLAACSARSREKALDFSWGRVAEKYLSVYERAVASNRTTG